MIKYHLKSEREERTRKWNRESITPANKAGLPVEVNEITKNMKNNQEDAPNDAKPPKADGKEIKKLQNYH